MGIAVLILILVLALWLQSVIFGRWAFRGLEYRCGFSVPEAHEGDELYLVETVHNRKLLPVPWLKVDIHSSRWLDFAGTNSVIAQDSRRVTSSFLLKSHQRVTRRWKLKCLKRGVFTTENVTLLSGDMLGHNNVSTAVRVDATLVVYPEVIDLEELFTPVNFLQGEVIVRRWVVDDPFIISGAREYTPRDSMNRIHWQATAREGRLMVKKNDFTSQLSLTILLNIQSIEFEYNDVVDRNRIELGIKAAATLLDRALRAGMPARLCSNGCTIDDDRCVIYSDLASGRDHICDLLKILAKLELRNVRDFELFLEDIADDFSRNEIVIITSYMNEAIADLSGRMTAAGNVVKFLVLDYLLDPGKLPAELDVLVLAPPRETKAS